MAMLKKGIWFSILLLSLAGVLALAAGFHQALSVTGAAARTAATPAVRDERSAGLPAPVKKRTNAVSVVIMGDSIARGTGDQSGKGFSSYLPEYFKSLTPKEIVVHNAGIDGLRSRGLLELLDGGTLRQEIVDADLLILSIGGNDLRRIRRTTDVTKGDVFRETFEDYLTALKGIVKALRQVNGDALLIFVGLYNPLEKESTADDISLFFAWNQGTETLVNEGKRAIFIPTYDLFRFNGAKFIAPDAIHPNAAGYQAIANRIAKSIEGYFNGGIQPE
jgi:lysophospholipase L1-like esterase